MILINSRKFKTTLVIASWAFIAFSFLYSYQRLLSFTLNIDPSQPKSYSTTIPNKVHYVWVMEPPTGDFKFDFTHFLSVYAAHFHFKPDTIFIHTDASAAAIARAKSSEAKTVWTRLIFNLPSVVINNIHIPRTVPGRPYVRIKKIEHISDFARVKVMLKYGGIYMDFDMYALRNIAELREMGYANVMAKEKYGKINNGAWMCNANTELMRQWESNMPIAYDGGWTTHGNDLISKLAKKMLNEREVLVLDEEAFHPVSWEPEDREELLKVRNGTKSYGPTIPLSESDNYWYGPFPHEEWDRDWVKTYMIHAFEVDGKQYANVTMEYVLWGQSPFARALFPPLRDAFEKGIIPYNSVHLCIE